MHFSKRSIFISFLSSDGSGALTWRRTQSSFFTVLLEEPSPSGLDEPLLGHALFPQRPVNDIVINIGVQSQEVEQWRPGQELLEDSGGTKPGEPAGQPMKGPADAEVPALLSQDLIAYHLDFFGPSDAEPGRAGPGDVLDAPRVEAR